MTRVLVTGATGFVGRHLCRALAERGIETIRAGLATAGDEPERTFDLRVPEQVAGLIESVAPDAVFHLAAQSSAGRSFGHPLDTFRTNALGTLHLLEAVRSRAPRARVLMVASGDMYGPSSEGAPHTETAPLCPRSPYATSKACQDLLTAQYGTAYNLDTVRLRPFSHTGPGQPPVFVLPGFASQIAAAEAGLAPPVLRVGRLDVIRDYTDVRDVVICYCEALLKASRGSVWNVCSGRGYSLRDLAGRLTSMARIELRIEEDPGRRRPADLEHLVGDPTRARQELGWVAGVTMDTSLSDLLEEARTTTGAA